MYGVSANPIPGLAEVRNKQRADAPGTPFQRGNSLFPPESVTQAEKLGRLFRV